MVLMVEASGLRGRTRQRTPPCHEPTHAIQLTQNTVTPANKNFVTRKNFLALQAMLSHLHSQTLSKFVTVGCDRRERGRALRACAPAALPLRTAADQLIAYQQCVPPG
ncbi:hypothetical protein O0L34_g6066 [Tuta absoluta]|nr:hypothetical protein O0L34_g6066 [Tuta absoluta]